MKPLVISEDPKKLPVFGALDIGDTFLFENGLYQKIVVDQRSLAVRLGSGLVSYPNPDDVVTLAKTTISYVKLTSVI